MYKILKKRRKKSKILKPASLLLRRIGNKQAVWIRIFKIFNQTPTYHIMIIFNSSLYLEMHTLVQNNFLKGEGGTKLSPFCFKVIKFCSAWNHWRESCVGRQRGWMLIEFKACVDPYLSQIRLLSLPTKTSLIFKANMCDKISRNLPEWIDSQTSETFETYRQIGLRNQRKGNMDPAQVFLKMVFLPLNPMQKKKKSQRAENLFSLVVRNIK